MLVIIQNKVIVIVIEAFKKERINSLVSITQSIQDRKTAYHILIISIRDFELKLARRDTKQCIYLYIFIYIYVYIMIYLYISILCFFEISIL
jgi:hypothetical protein